MRPLALTDYSSPRRQPARTSKKPTLHGSKTLWRNPKKLGIDSWHVLELFSGQQLPPCMVILINVWYR